VGVRRDVGRTKRPINPTNGGIAIIPPCLSAGQSMRRTSMYDSFLGISDAL